MAVGLAPWRKPLAIHDPAKVVTDLAVALGLGGDCLADIGLLRAEPGLFGLVASDPTVSRMIDALAKDASAALKAINAARAAARAQVWELAGQHAPHVGIDAATPLVIDVDATLSRHIRTRSPPLPPINVASGFTRCGPLLTTAAKGPGSRWRCCCGLVTPGRTRPLITW